MPGGVVGGMDPKQFLLWQSGYRRSVALVTQRWGIPNSFSKIHLTFLSSVLMQPRCFCQKCQWPGTYSTHLSITGSAFRFQHQRNRRRKCRLLGNEVKSPLNQISSKPPYSHTHHLQLLVATVTFSQQLCCQHLVTEREAPFLKDPIVTNCQLDFI